MIEIILLLFAGFAAGLVGATAGGGGGIISFFALIFLGLPIQNAVAINRLGDLGVYPLSLKNFFESKKINFPIVIQIIPLAVIGGTLGAILLVVIDSSHLNWIIPLILFFILVFLLLKKDVGVKQGKKHSVWPITYFISAIYSGFFVGFTGIIAVASLTFFRGMKMIEANATNLVANFIIGIIGSIIFIFAGLVDFSLVLPLFLGNLFGGWIGSKLVLKKGNRWARLVVIVVLLTAIIKLVFFP